VRGFIVPQPFYIWRLVCEGCYWKDNPNALSLNLENEMEEEWTLVEKFAIEKLKRKFGENNNSVEIPLIKGKNTFQANLNEKGINVSNLATQSHLSWEVFEETIRLLKEKNGCAIKGDAMNYKLGETGLPIDSIEGRIAYKIYGKQLGQNVFRRITPIACILVWAGICVNQRGKLLLLNEDQRIG
jgi:hypothetical protein